MDDETPGTAPNRLPYHAPTLKDHGTIQELTLTNITGETFDDAGYVGDYTPPIS